MKKLIIVIICCILAVTLASITVVLWDEMHSTPEIPTTEVQDAPQQSGTTRQILGGICICVDAGHGINSYSKQEPIAPGSSETKAAFAGGTHGKNLTEEELNLIIAQKLEERLIGLGATVYMTRTTHESDMTNIDRAQFANEKNADISVKIHADGLDNQSANGVSVLVPSNKHIKDETIINKSRHAGELILSNVIKHTGAQSRGVLTRGDLTGFNWSQVPVVLIEVGFMTNPQEDAKLETPEYQDKIVDGIVDGLIAYFEIQ